VAEEARWAEQNTNPERIEAALRELLRERHAANQTLAPARVLNLVVVIDREWKGEIVNRLDGVGRYHASRTIVCEYEAGRHTIDATAVISGDASTDGSTGVLRETVEMYIGLQHLRRLDTVIDPVIVSELPTVLWSPHSLDEGVEALLGMIDVILIDSDDPAHFDGPAAGLSRAKELTEAVYVVDLAWLRTIPWRERLAAWFDAPSRRHELADLDRVTVRHQADSVVSALLLSGWLSSRLGWLPGALVPCGVGAREGAAVKNGSETPGVSVDFQFDPVDLPVRGIAGVTVGGAGGWEFSLDRRRGGMTAREVDPGGVAREWHVLGASRGEGGILGEGVRQALLRDPTYAPALTMARRFCP
jgi:glucose-6-phosphate dehydrogenase assembly protein OpcA